MDERNWYVSTHGDRVVLTLPPLEDGKGAGYVYDMSTVEATEIAAALTEAAGAVGQD
jgi:hypothetical protein